MKYVLIIDTYDNFHSIDCETEEQVIAVGNTTFAELPASDRENLVAMYAIEAVMPEKESERHFEAKRVVKEWK